MKNLEFSIVVLNIGGRWRFISGTLAFVLRGNQCCYYCQHHQYSSSSVFIIIITINNNNDEYCDNCNLNLNLNLDLNLDSGAPQALHA